MDLRKLKTLIDLVSESGISELEVTEPEGKVRIVKTAPQAAMIAAPMAAPVMAAAAPVAAAAPAAAPGRPGPHRGGRDHAEHAADGRPDLPRRGG